MTSCCGDRAKMHLRVALERLRERFGVNVKSQTPGIGYQETIRKSIVQRGRHKKQSGGHGQFGDVVLEIAPMPRGGGFTFQEKAVGGAVAAELHRRRRGRRGRWTAARTARFSRHRRPCDLDRRVLPQRGFVGSRVPHRGADRRQRSAAAVPAGVAGADPCGRDRLSDRRHRQDQRHPVGHGAARFSASTPARAGRDGIASAP